MIYKLTKFCVLALVGRCFFLVTETPTIIFGLNSTTSVVYSSDDSATLIRKSNISYGVKETRQHATKGRLKSDLVVILDIDECLVHNEIFEISGKSLLSLDHQMERSNNTLSPSRHVKSTFNFTVLDEYSMHVYERPFLHEFLRNISQKFETHIFTSGMKGFAAPVVKMMDPNGTIFSKVYYRESCTHEPCIHAYIKDLTFINQGGDKLKRTVLVDNNLESMLSQPDNGIPVRPFYDDADDTSLPSVFDFIEYLDSKDDVRPVLNARFGVRKMLDEVVNSGDHGCTEDLLKYKISSGVLNNSKQEEIDDDDEEGHM